MRQELILATILYIRNRLLKHPIQFTVGRYFSDKYGNPLPGDASSLPRVAVRCIGGAVIEALVELKINVKASDSSSDYQAVMCSLSDSLGDLGDLSVYQKVKAVMKLNNEGGYAAIRALIDKTTAALFEKLAKQ